jgi:hypothetical protein
VIISVNSIEGFEVTCTVHHYCIFIYIYILTVCTSLYLKLIEVQLSAQSLYISISIEGLALITETLCVFCEVGHISCMLSR